VGGAGRCFGARGGEHVGIVGACAGGRALGGMHGPLTVAWILASLASSTGALFALEGLWRLGTPLRPGMLAVVLSRFRAGVVFFFKKAIVT